MNGVKLPKRELEDVEDCYTEYVELVGISEDIFWYADVAFVKKVANNKEKYLNWIRIRSE